MKPAQEDPDARSERLTKELDDRRELGAEALHQGEVAEARDHFAAALEIARQLDHQEDIDLAFCDFSAVTIELGGAQEALGGLREILVRSPSPSNSCRAAYNVARIYELDKEWKKALFYGRVARDHAYRGEGRDWRARCHNLLGNVLLAESRVQEAVDEYERALELIPQGEVTWTAFILDNLGYGRFLLGEHAQGFSLLFRSLRTFQRLGLRRFAIEPHLDLSFAYLEIGRFRTARRHGEKALRWALEIDEREAHKKALYLLGQTAVMLEEPEQAHRLFSELQASHYPDKPGMAEFLLAVDVRQLVNLKA